MMKWLVPVVCLLLLAPALASAQAVSEVAIPEALGHYQAPAHKGFPIDISRQARNLSSLGVFWQGNQTLGTFVDANAPGMEFDLPGVLRVNLIDPAGPVWTCDFVCRDPFVEELGGGDLRAAMLFSSETGTSLDFLRNGAVDMEVMFFPCKLMPTQTVVVEPELDIDDFKLDLTGGTVDTQSETWGSVKALYN